MKSDVKEDAKARLARMGRRVGDIARMIDGDCYCVDILTEVAALRAALEQVGGIVLKSHIEECVYGSAVGEACKELSPNERIEEVRLALGRFLK